MKNTWLLLAALMIVVSVLPWGQRSAAFSTPGQQSYQVIPDEAIRLRILADSNADEAQQLKREVRDEVNQEITTWVEDLTSIEEARTLIKSRIGEIDHIVGDTMKEQGIEQDYTVEYNKRVDFPTKLYGNYIYPAGEYEAILITIGKGEGDNWWCVLFPPLCFLDFSNGTSVAKAEEDQPEQEQQADEQEEEKEVEFFVVKLWDKLFS
ncbi:stage II sporulation protein R [Halobacillus salinarum]|uniref:Stage II sporulation protein R n=1 Tax=Halobacillus salinarum TaxID=2932257 RepID=A0ABY4EPK4_9BACI|nr:stage II sporulation protein R [Halobacillus salinarum]UOQ46389.1 stage II sporulation protein R [Halobacillus salinarum]